MEIVEKTRKRIASEMKYKKDRHNVLIGTLDKKICKSIYVRLEMYMKPYETYDDSTGALKRRLTKVARNYCKALGVPLKHYIVSYDYPDSVITRAKRNRKTFIAVEITLFSSELFAFDESTLYLCNKFADNIFSQIDSITNFDIV